MRHLPPFEIRLDSRDARVGPNSSHVSLGPNHVARKAQNFVYKIVASNIARYLTIQAPPNFSDA